MVCCTKVRDEAGDGSTEQWVVNNRLSCGLRRISREGKVTLCETRLILRYN